MKGVKVEELNQYKDSCIDRKNEMFNGDFLAISAPSLHPISCSLVPRRKATFRTYPGGVQHLDIASIALSMGSPCPSPITSLRHYSKEAGRGC
jgi:hypothetical protein